MTLALCVSLLADAGQASALANEGKFVFETWSKERVDAVKGSFTVPENRDIPGSPLIPIKYVRLAATGDRSGPPIVYLAGGPGGSGIQAINYRYRMFMAMRKHGDVIALDQRGTGTSDVTPECQSRQTVPTTTATPDKRFAEYHREALRECLAFWRQQGVDIAGYDTVQNAQDLEALRRHLGAKRVVLWGTSYGSHLALAALREMRGGIDRVIVSSVEGLNQTLKLPERTDRYFERLQTAIDTQPGAKAAYPDITALMRRVHARLERQPLRIQLKTRGGSNSDYLLQRRDMQVLAAGLIADPRSAALLLSIYRAIDQGAEPPLDRIPARMLSDLMSGAGQPITLRAMPVAMDIASGMTAVRRRQVAAQARTALLGNYLDSAMLFDGMASELDLGDAFRAGPESDVPVLALSGTLDGRTTIDSQREALMGLTKATLVTVENAGHNLYDEPVAAIQEAIDRFMQGGAVGSGVIEVELPDMAPPRAPQAAH